MEDWLPGHWAFVVPAYAVTVLAVGGLVAASLRAHARARRALHRADRDRKASKGGPRP